MGAGMNSPAVGMLGLGAFVTRTGMTPAGMGADLVGMAEGIGGTLALTARDQEDERRRRIEKIVDMVARRWGRVSPEGVERCARRVGFECLWEEGSDTKRTLSIAGQGVLIDVEFTGEQVQHVGLSFPASGEEAMRAAPEGAEVLKRDLQGDRKGYVMLDRFVTNLERLATMDRLGAAGVSSFDAVDGIGGCLRSLFAWEVQKLRKERGGQDDPLDVETAVMCTGSGRPQMHSRGRMGLSLQYWTERRFLDRPRRAEMEMNVEAKVNADGPSPTPRRKKREPVVYSALIDCEACSDIYPPIRVSSAWVSDAVGKPPEALDAFSGLFDVSSVDWQEPLPTLVSSEADANANATVDQMSIDGVTLISAGKTPNVRFVARLDPPVIVPLQVALIIYDSVGAPIAQEGISPTTFEALLLSSGVNGLTKASSLNNVTNPPPNQKPQEQPSHTVEQTIMTYDAGGRSFASKHRYTLFNPTQTFAYLIENIPFSHPRQIVAILPSLRQWALIGSILRRNFTPSSTSLDQKKRTHEEEEDKRAELAMKQARTLDEELAAFLSLGKPDSLHNNNNHPSSSSLSSPSPASSPPSSPSHSSPPPLAVDVSLAFTPAPPRLTCVFELEGQLRSLVFGVNVNGEVVVIGGKGGEEGGGSGGGGGAGGGGGIRGVDVGGVDETTSQLKLKKVIEISESIGVAIAWLQARERERRKNGKGQGQGAGNA